MIRVHIVKVGATTYRWPTTPWLSWHPDLQAVRQHVAQAGLLACRSSRSTAVHSASWRPDLQMVTPSLAKKASRPAGSHNGGSDSEGEAGTGSLTRWKAWLGVQNWTREHDKLTREDELVLHVSGAKLAV